jgi:uncharacterized protein YbaP (TraB family)
MMLAIFVTSCVAPPPQDVKGIGPALWVARSGNARIYLFGTVHLLVGPVAWLTPTVQSAFAASHELWVETAREDRAALQRAMQARALDPLYDLAARLGLADRGKLAELMRQCGVGKEYSTHVRAWAVNVLLAGCGLRAQARPSNGSAPSATAMPDSYLVSLAHAAGVSVHSLEAPAQQIAALADVPDAVQVALLLRALHGEPLPNDAPVLSAAQVEGTWMDGDIDALGREVDASDRQGTADIYQSVYKARNQRFADEIAHLLTGDRVAFVAIGAGHLAGAANVRAQLRTRGISVARLE